MSPEGKMVSCGKTKGRLKAMELLVDKVAELGDNIKDHRFYIGHTDAPELAQEVVRMMKERFGDDLAIEFVVTNPTAGSHSGPNGVGVCFHAIHR
jgi:fatty acid-binding protein DegV